MRVELYIIYLDEILDSSSVLLCPKAKWTLLLCFLMEDVSLQFFFLCFHMHKRTKQFFREYIRTEHLAFCYSTRCWGAMSLLYKHCACGLSVFQKPGVQIHTLMVSSMSGRQDSSVQLHLPAVAVLIIFHLPWSNTCVW